MSTHPRCRFRRVNWTASAADCVIGIGETSGTIGARKVHYEVVVVYVVGQQRIQHVKAFVDNLDDYDLYWHAK